MVDLRRSTLSLRTPDRADLPHWMFVRSPRTVVEVLRLGKNTDMGWIATVVLFVATGLGVCFTVVRMKTLWAEVQIARRERAAHPGPKRSQKARRTLVILVMVYGSLAVALFIGWQAANATVGALSTLCVALAWVFGAAAFAVRSVWVSRK